MGIRIPAGNETPTYPQIEWTVQLEGIKGWTTVLTALGAQRKYEEQRGCGATHEAALKNVASYIQMNMGMKPQKKTALVTEQLPPNAEALLRSKLNGSGSEALVARLLPQLQGHILKCGRSTRRPTRRLRRRFGR
jgi:hypothetical protein